MHQRCAINRQHAIMIERIRWKDFFVAGGGRTVKRVVDRMGCSNVFALLYPYVEQTAKRQNGLF